MNTGNIPDLVKRLREPEKGFLHLVTVKRRSTGETIETLDPLKREAADTIERLQQADEVHWKTRRALLADIERLQLELAAQAKTVEAMQKDAQGWLLISEAPMFICGRDALVGQLVAGFGWRKVTVWEPEWSRDEIISRGGTHWWPHLRDLPVPPLDAARSEGEKP